MQLDFSAVITDLKGKPMKDPDGAEFTLGTAIAQACVAGIPGDDKQQPSGDEKYKRFKLAVLATGGGPKELSAEQIVTIKKVIGGAYGELVVGRVYDMLDPAAA